MTEAVTFLHTFVDGEPGEYAEVRLPTSRQEGPRREIDRDVDQSWLVSRSPFPDVTRAAGARGTSIKIEQPISGKSSTAVACSVDKN
jgi:hypothetical protein